MTAIGDDTYSKDMRFKVGLRYFFACQVSDPTAAVLRSCPRAADRERSTPAPLSQPIFLRLIYVPGYGFRAHHYLIAAHTVIPETVHAGGTVPMMVGRMRQYAPADIGEKVANGIEYELKRLYYEIAGTAHRPAIAALTSFVPTRQILFGSDHPFIPLAETAEGVTKLGLSESDLQLITHDTALRLMPRLKRY